MPDSQYKYPIYIAIDLQLNLPSNLHCWILRWFIINCCNITDKVYRGGWWEGGEVGVEGGGKLKAGNTIHSETNSSIVSSVEHRNFHSQPGRRRHAVIGSSLTHYVALLVPLSGSIDPVVDCHGFTGSAKDCL